MLQLQRVLLITAHAMRVLFFYNCKVQRYNLKLQNKIVFLLKKLLHCVIFCVIIKKINLFFLGGRRSKKK